MVKGEQEEVQGYQYIVEKFGQEKVQSRTKWLYDLLCDYITENNLTDQVNISRSVLKHVLVDYFVDIDRLKDFSEIPKANDSKIYAYSCFWLLRHKPLQINQQSDAQSLAFVNEDFVAHLLRSYLFSAPDNIPVMNNQKEDVDNFVRTLLY